MDPARVIGILIKEGLPLTVNFYDVVRKEEFAMKQFQISRQELKELREVTLGNGIEEAKKYIRPAGCKTCQIPDVKASAGRQLWNLLHATASAYPDYPGMEDESRFRSFIMSSISSFPCHECSSDALAYLDTDPLDFTSRTSLEASVCRLHNHVNGKLGKPIHKCHQVPA